MGTPDFAVPVLERLTEKHEVCGVFTQPDRPKGRKMELTPSEVKVCAVKHGIPVFQPESLKHGEAMPVLEELQPDVIVVAAYGQILRRDVLHFPKYGCVNAHGSLLPKYRGAAPVQRAVLDGESCAGVTAMKMDEGLDTGDMLMMKSVEIGPDETAGELFDRLSVLAADVIEETLDDIEHLLLTAEKQDDALSTYAKMLSKTDCPVDWNCSAQEVHNHIRGLNPWPVATATLNGEIYKLFRSQMSGRKTDASPGTVRTEKGKLFAACGDGTELEIIEIQPQNGKRMSVSAYLLGHELKGVFD